MASVTVTVSTIDGATPLNSLQAIDSKDIISMTSSDNLTTGTAVLKVRRWEGRAQGAVPKIESWVTTQSYATVLAAVNAADAEAGAQLTAEKDASGGYAGLTLLKINFKNVLNTFTSFFTNSNTAARTYTFQDRDGTIADDTDLATKQSTSGKDATGGYAGLTLFKINFKNAANTFTSFFTNANTAARTYTFPDKDGTAAMTNDFGKKATTALVAGELIVADSLIGANSAVAVQRIVPGGTVSAGGYKVTLSAGVGYTINALKADGTTIENANTDTVCAVVVY